MDVVIKKADGLPTYHFAHVIDDHFLRTTHVIRGEEWLASLPIHIALFGAVGFEPPTYCHTAVLMKIDENGTKRKLSKRKDPELSLSYYTSEGYHPRAIEEYLLTIINSDFEEWRAENPEAPTSDFTMTTEKMGVSGILVDIEKLNDVSKNTLINIPATDLADFMEEWAKEARPELVQVFKDNRETLVKAIDIGRFGDKPRKDLAYAGQIFDFLSFFFDDYFKVVDEAPENVPAGDVKVLLEAYLASYDHSDDRDVWFDKIRTIAVENGYAAKPKDFKKNPDEYKGHVGDVSTVIRLALVGRTSSPDVYEIQQILGEEKVKARIKAMIDNA
jgi:glutamyl-tRNA synthetase